MILSDLNYTICAMTRVFKVQNTGHCQARRNFSDDTRGERYCSGARFWCVNQRLALLHYPVTIESGGPVSVQNE